MKPLLRISHRDTDTRARSGTLSLPHGEVETPAFMPVGTAATVKAMTHQRVHDQGYRLILGNTYHLFLRPGLDVIQGFGGLHQFSGWSGNILTDSGGYQVFSLSNLRRINDDGVQFQSHIDGSRHLFTPETVVDAQVVFGSDIQMALDECTGPDATRADAEQAMMRTTAWARRAKARWMQARDGGYPGSLFGIVQGNFHQDLRKQSAAQIAELELLGIAIGGLSVGEEPSVFREVLSYTSELLPWDVPHYLMGIGTPDYIFDAVANGIDMFDCVFPTRIARNGTVLTWDGRVVLKHEAHIHDTQPISPGCECLACRRYSRGYLRHLFKTGEMLGPMLATDHNLWFLGKLLSGIRASIPRGEFQAYRKQVMSRYTEGERIRQQSR